MTFVLKEVIWLRLFFIKLYLLKASDQSVGIKLIGKNIGIEQILAKIKSQEKKVILLRVPYTKLNKIPIMEEVLYFKMITLVNKIQTPV